MNVTRPMMGLAMLGIGIVLLTVKIYLAIYKKRANRKLAEGISGETVDDKPMIPPIMVGIFTFLATVTIVYLLMIILVGIFSKASRNDGTPQPYIHYCSLTEEDRQGTVFEGVKVGEPIAGYNMYTQQQGNIKLTYYISKMPYAGLSAQMLLAYEYTGEPNICETADSVHLTQTDNGSGGFGSYGNKYDPDCLTAITLDEYSGTMELEIGVFDKPAEELAKDEDKGDFPCLPTETVMKYASEKETFSFDWSDLEQLAYSKQ